MEEPTPVEYVAVEIACEADHQVLVLKAEKGSHSDFVKSWYEIYDGKCPRCKRELKHKMKSPEAYDLWASREDGRYADV